MATTASLKPAFWLHPFVCGIVAAILLVSAATMRMTRAVNRGAEDFFACGVMLALRCAGIEAACHDLATSSRQIAAIIVAVWAFMIVQAEPAVGLFD